MQPYYTPTHIARFWSRVNKTEGCWFWTGKLQKSGYGYFVTTSKQYAHRMAWELTYGAIPPSLFVCHTCDEKTCVNPAHLFLGSSRTNSEDMRMKQRHVKGMSHSNAKLTDDAIRDIRSRYAAGVSGIVLAKTYGVTPATISSIIHRFTWRHIS